jgi:hypothetical protein
MRPHEELIELHLRMLRGAQHSIVHIDDQLPVEPHLQHAVVVGDAGLHAIQPITSPDLMPVRPARGAGVAEQDPIRLPHFAIDPILA